STGDRPASGKPDVPQEVVVAGPIARLLLAEIGVQAIEGRRYPAVYVGRECEVVQAEAQPRREVGHQSPVEGAALDSASQPSVGSTEQRGKSRSQIGGGARRAPVRERVLDGEERPVLGRRQRPTEFRKRLRRPQELEPALSQVRLCNGGRAHGALSDRWTAPRAARAAARCPRRRAGRWAQAAARVSASIATPIASRRLTSAP